MQVVPISKEGYQLFHEGQIAFSDIQQNGIKIDTKHCKQQYSQLGREMKNVSKRLEDYKEIQLWKKIYGKKFNINSDDQLADILFNKIGYEPAKVTEQGNPSVDKESLNTLDISSTNDLLRYRKLDKLRNTFLRNLIKETYNGFLHPFINLNFVRTFRSSGSNPNTQNIPHRDEEGSRIIRTAFRAREGSYLVASDYGGIEVKGSQFYTRDPVMQSYLDEPETADMHADFCKSIFRLESFDDSDSGLKTLRKGTKNGFTFPQFYGDYYGNNAVSLWDWADLKGKTIGKNSGVKLADGTTIGQHLRNKGIKNFDQFKNHVANIEHDMWQNRFKVYKKWRDDQWNWYNKHGYVSLLSGFTCQGIMTRNQTINYPIQGVCFHCLLWSVIQLNKILKERKMKTKIIFQVHDEVIADVPKEEYNDYIELVKQVMCHDIKDHFTWVCTPLELESECSELEGNWANMSEVMKYIN